jgi:cytochrome c5
VSRLVGSEMCIRDRNSIKRTLGAVNALTFCAAAFIGVISVDAMAQPAERSGKEVVEATCAGCHAKGEKGAPKIGDKAAWSKRAEQTLSSLTDTALKGIRQMPPHGANMKLTDTEIKRAVTYMVNQSGGNWVEPSSKTAAPVERTGEQVVKLRCGECHEKGLHGAPKVGDADAWIPRVKNGLDAVVRSAINGHGGMPARGGIASLTDSEIRNAIVYMMNKGRVYGKDAK